MTAFTLIVSTATLLSCTPERDEDAMADDAEPISTSSPRPPRGAAPMGSADTVYVAELRPAGEGAQSISGTVTFLSEPGTPTLHVELAADGLPPGDHAWHIHQGACGQSGPVTIALSPTEAMRGSAAPVTAGSDGHAEARAEVPGLDASSLGEGQRSLHLHQQGGVDHGPSIACALL